MPNMYFRGAFLRYFDVRKDEESAVFIRIHLTANFSKPVCEAMEWEELPKCYGSSKLKGSLTGSHLILTPNGGKDMKQHEMQFAVNDVSDFAVFPIKNDEGDIVGRELRFIARTSENVEGVLGEYLRTVGRGEGQLKVVYQKQGNLPLDEAQAQEETEDEEVLV